VAENFYQILGIGVRANQAEIKAAYKKLALQYHPDRHQGSSLYEEKFKKILEAYQTLSDPQKKDRYDMSLFYKAMGASGKESSGPDVAYRNVPRTPREREDEAYQKRKADREAYRDFAGPPKEKRISPHAIAIALLIVSCFIMLSYWLGYAMNHHMARKHMAEGDFVKALEFDDEYAEAYHARYQAAFRMNPDAKFLLRDLNAAIRFSDEPNPIWLMERATIYLSMDSITHCERDLLSARKANPNLDTVCLVLGDFYGRVLNQPSKALAYYDSAIQIQPANFPALLGKGEMLFRLKRFSKALPVLSACIEKGGNYKQLFFYRGSVLLALGKREEACLDLNQALNMGQLEAKDLVEQYCEEQN
jgi:tetratricopeptide (TPR) repeat protein